jgi:hypothetical protein
MKKWQTVKEDFGHFFGIISDNDCNGIYCRTSLFGVSSSRTQSICL